MTEMSWHLIREYSLPPFDYWCESHPCHHLALYYEIEPMCEEYEDNLIQYYELGRRGF